MSRLCCRSLQTPPRRWKSGARSIVLSLSRNSSSSTVRSWVPMPMPEDSSGAGVETRSVSSSGSSSSTPVDRPFAPSSTAGSAINDSQRSSPNPSPPGGCSRWFPDRRVAGQVNSAFTVARILSTTVSTPVAAPTAVVRPVSSMFRRGRRG